MGGPPGVTDSGLAIFERIGFNVSNEVVQLASFLSGF